MSSPGGALGGSAQETAGGHPKGATGGGSSSNWLEFSAYRPHASVYLHQAAALLHNMDQAFTCSLCGLVFQNPLALQPCHHAFCNDCIYKTLLSKSQQERRQQQQGPSAASPTLRCPCCQTRLDDSLDLALSLVPSRNFEEAARHYKTLRPLLQKALQVSSTDSSSSISGNRTANSPGGISDGKSTARASLTGHKRKSSVGAASPATGATFKGRKKGNPFIREQFQVEWVADKETWAFVCLHCHMTAITSKNKVWNASFLTQHICSKCPVVSKDIKEQAIRCSQRTIPPDYSALGKQQQLQEQHKSMADIKCEHEKGQNRSALEPMEPQQHQDDDDDDEDDGGEDDDSYEPYLDQVKL